MRGISWNILSTLCTGSHLEGCFCYLCVSFLWRLWLFGLLEFGLVWLFAPWLMFLLSSLFLGLWLLLLSAILQLL